MRIRNLSWLALALLAACGSPSTGEENIINPGGKEDNYFSSQAQEYLLSADVTIKLTEAEAQLPEAERTKLVETLMTAKTELIGWFLHNYIHDKSRSDENYGFGGLRAMVLDDSFENESLRVDPQDPALYHFTLKLQAGGAKSFVSLLSRDGNYDSEKQTFQLKMEKLSNAQLALVDQAYASKNWGHWKPADATEVEELAVKVAPIANATDGYLDYAKMLEDGVMDISVHFGWDYHKRYDITSSRSIYNWLTTQMGYTSPSESYDQYNRLSGPLTKKIQVNGREIEVRVSLFRPDPCESMNEDSNSSSWHKEHKKSACEDFGWENPEAVSNPTTSQGAGRMKKDLIHSLQNRDVVMFEGHSGYTYSYALANWYKTAAGDLDPPEIRTMDLPADRSQLFMISGCSTYHVGQAFKANPNKLGLNNVDVITSTSFTAASDSSGIREMIRALGGQGNSIEAASYAQLMTKLNPQYSTSSYYYYMFGVHGIDDNPRGNPFADASKNCQACETDADCGAQGNVCVRLNDDEKVCATKCLSDAGCGQDETCKQFGSSTSFTLGGNACVPKSLSCETAPPPPPAPKKFEAEGVVEEDGTQFFSVDVGASAKNIKVQLTSNDPSLPDQDADLYVRFNEAPSKSLWDCRPFDWGSEETCDFAQARGAKLEIMVHGWSDNPSPFKVTVTWE